MHYLTIRNLGWMKETRVFWTMLLLQLNSKAWERGGGGGISPADFDGKLPIILVFALPTPTCFVWGLRIVAVAQLPSLIYPNFWVSACEFGLKNKLEMVVFVIYVNLVFISAW